MNKFYTIALKGEENETKGLIAVLCDEKEWSKVDCVVKTAINSVKHLKGQMAPEANWVSEILWELNHNGYQAFEIEVDNYFEVDDTIL